MGVVEAEQETLFFLNTHFSSLISGVRERSWSASVMAAVRDLLLFRGPSS